MLADKTATPAKSQVIRFDCYEADLESGTLHKRGLRVGLREQSFQVLAALLQHPGQLLTREELRRRLWGDRIFVNFDNNLNAVVAHLREVLCDTAEHPRFIETLPRRGYRFIATVYNSPTLPQPIQTLRPRVVVLPFVNLNGDPAQGYLSDALTDGVITALASLAPQQLAVIARTTAMHYKGSHKDVARIASELGVHYVVEGALRHSKEQIAINVQLIQASDQTHVFASKYEAEPRDIFVISNSIAQEIAMHIPNVAETGGKPITRMPTENLTAYSEYVHGRYEMWKWTRDGVAKAKQHFEDALTHDPHFALAYDGLANFYWYLGFWGFLPPEETEPIRRFYALRAAELDPTLAEAQTLIAFRPEKCHYDEAYAYNWTDTEQQMARARDLRPNSPLIRIRHASVLAVLGRTDEGIVELDSALEFDPLSVEARFWLVLELFLGRQYVRAHAEAHKLLELEPDHHVSYMVLGQVYLGMQDFDESATAFRRAIEISGGVPLMMGWLGLALGLGGHWTEATRVLDRLRMVAGESYVLPTTFAWLHLGLGLIDEAFVWMDRAVERNDGWISALKTYPFLDPLRSDPRLHALLRKMNLEP